MRILSIMALVALAHLQTHVEHAAPHVADAAQVAKKRGATSGS